MEFFRNAFSRGSPESSSMYSTSPDEPQHTTRKDAPVTASLLTGDTLNQNIVNAEYAVRGEILDRAMELKKELDTQKSNLPFEDVIMCNIGNPQALSQQPLTYNRQILSIVMNPSILETHTDAFPEDVVKRAREFLAGMPNLGAYTNTQGLPIVRKCIAEFIEARDGHPSDPEKIFVTNGASEGVRNIMMSLIRDGELGYNDGVLVPIPQYPLYSALSTMFKATLVPYYLDEANGWSLSLDALRDALEGARARGVTVRGLVVINPGNPTGQVLSVEDMRGIVDLCVREGLILCADEVYQENVWEEGKEFVSFRKVAIEMGYTGEEEITKPGEGLQLVSFHSVSKGFLGECGLRGGYFQVHGIPAAAAAQVYKLASISLCSNTVGQLTTGLMCALPRPGSPSFKKFARERDAILGSMRRRAGQLGAALNRLEGVSCNSAQGAMYVFPRITLPRRAVAAAAAEGVAPDAFYCMRLLEATGIIVVPGSGFGQQEGTWHFRTTFLPSEARMAGVVDRLARFHAAFMDQYRDD
mmetsp:Transcript_10824/g.17474  ORF Transcript_10824/g.17474 Transcript_10824/m.17474 type:complete len:528 (-) Transcript_10824:16-1599(-)